MFYMCATSCIISRTAASLLIWVLLNFEEILSMIDGLKGICDCVILRKPLGTHRFVYSSAEEAGERLRLYLLVRLKEHLNRF